MFGSRIDYMLLRTLAHDANIASESDLNEDDTNPVVLESRLGGGQQRLERLRRVFGSGFPIDPDLRYLDVGCGEGEMPAALALAGCTSVTGVEIVERHAAAADRLVQHAGLSDRVDIICQDIHAYSPAAPFDVVTSFDAFEHIDDPRSALEGMRRLVAPGGLAILAFGPLFRHPFGDHMAGFFRVPIPWRGVLFSEQALLRVRREFYRPTDPAERLQDIVGGLNLMRFSEFLEYVEETGWKVQWMSVNPGTARLKPLHWLSEGLLRVPGVRDYVAGHVYAVLRDRRAAG